MAVVVRNLNVRGRTVVGVEPLPISTWTLTFIGGDCGSISCETNAQTIPENVTLYFDRQAVYGVATVTFFKNNVFFFVMDSSFNTTTLSFNANDTLKFVFSGLGSEGTLFIKENNSSGRLISSVPFFVMD